MHIFFLMVRAKPKGFGDFLHKRQRYLTIYIVTEHKVMCPVCCDFKSVFKFHLNHFWTWCKFSALESHEYLAGKSLRGAPLVFC